MWIASIKVKHDCFILPKTIKYNIVDATYLLGLYKKSNYIFYTNIHLLSGRKENKIKFIDALRKDKKIIKCEGRGNQIYTLAKVSKKNPPLAYFFNKETFLLTPVIHENGIETWNIAAWEKKEIINFIKRIEKVGKVKLEKIQREFISDIFIHKIIPELTNKQREAIELAIKEGHYQIPKKIDTAKLAKLMNISRVTYQEHLRKAESKLLPFFLENSK